MNALLDPINRRTGSNKLGLIVHTAAMFVIVTINHATNLHPQSASFIDNRDFPPGPIVYLLSTSTTGISVVSNVAFSLNQWLADGLLVSSIPNPVIQGSNVADPLAVSLL